MLGKLISGCLYLLVFGSLYLLVDTYSRAGPLNIPGATRTGTYLVMFFVGLIGLTIRAR